LSCQELADLIRKRGYEIIRVQDEADKCIIDFRHPKVKIERPVAYFLSSVALDKKDGHIETTVRSKVDTYKELYLDYCCEDSEMCCRPHVSMEEKILSVEAKFHKSPKKKFDQLISELL